jgi:hypothetical protein
MQDGILVEHWDVLQDEVGRAVQEREAHVWKGSPNYCFLGALSQHYEMEV